MALAAGFHQMRGMNRRVRIVRAQDLVIAVATRAVRRQGRAAGGRQPVVTLEKRLHPVIGHPETAVDAFAGMALAARLRGLVRSPRILEPHDLVLRVAIDAGRRLAFALGIAWPCTLAVTSSASCGWHSPQVFTKLGHGS